MKLVIGKLYKTIATLNCVEKSKLGESVDLSYEKNKILLYIGQFQPWKNEQNYEENIKNISPYLTIYSQFLIDDKIILTYNEYLLDEFIEEIKIGE